MEEKKEVISPESPKDEVENKRNKMIELNTEENRNTGIF